MKQAHFKGHLFCIMGKSCTGKDTLYKALLSDPTLGLRPLVTYTTRPMRIGELEGVDYHFVTPEDLRAYEAVGELIEERIYQTVHGPWHYATVADNQLRDGSEKYLSIVTLAAYKALAAYFGQKRVIPLYISVDDYELITRAVARESKECKPNYKEVCRRFLADAQDFSEEELELAGIQQVFLNREVAACTEQLRRAILDKELR